MKSEFTTNNSWIEIIDLNEYFWTNKTIEVGYAYYFSTLRLKFISEIHLELVVNGYSSTSIVILSS